MYRRLDIGRRGTAVSQARFPPAKHHPADGESEDAKPVDRKRRREPVRPGARLAGGLHPAFVFQPQDRAGVEPFALPAFSAARSVPSQVRIGDERLENLFLSHSESVSGNSNRFKFLRKIQNYPTFRDRILILIRSQHKAWSKLYILVCQSQI